MIAAIQALPVPGNKEANLERIDAFAQKAAARGARVAVFPELFLTGYNLGAALADLSEPIDGPSVASLKAIAWRHRIGLIVGMPERRGDAIYNLAIVIGPEGDLRGAYRKTHLFGPAEKAMFRPGEYLCVVDVAGLRLGIAICYDIEFPEVARALTLAGVDVLCVPTANMEPFRAVPLTLVPARALENGVPIVYANLCGREGSVDYTGLSAIVGADGSDLARAGVADETLLLAEISPARGSMLPLSTQAADLRPQVLTRFGAGLSGTGGS